MSPLNQTILKIEGMSCIGCRGKVEKALQKVSGVTSIQVDLASKQAFITGNANHNELVNTVEELGFIIIADNI